MSPSKHTSHRDSTVAHRNALVLVFNAAACLDMLFSRAQSRNLNPMELPELSGGTVAST